MDTRQLTLENIEFAHKVALEVKVLDTQINSIQSFLDKLIVVGKPLVLKIEGELDDKPKSKIGESPFANNDGGVGEMEAMAQMMKMMGMNVVAIKRTDVEHEDKPSNILIDELISEQMIYKVVLLILEEKKERRENCINKLAEFGIRIED